MKVTIENKKGSDGPFSLFSILEGNVQFLTMMHSDPEFVRKVLKELEILDFCYTNKYGISATDIKSLNENEVFVFGSNWSGVHGAGAAYFANKKLGAELGVGEGLTGDCYALPTKDFKIVTLSLGAIEIGVNRFIETALKRPLKTFLVTEIGCGLAGYTPEQIAPMFSQATSIKNIKLPFSFWKVIINKES